MLKLKKTVIGLFALFAISSTSARATTTLQFVDRTLSGANNQATVQKGQEFDIRLNLITSASETVTGLDYFLKALGNGNGLFLIVDREISTSPWDDTLYADSVVEMQPASVLDPQNEFDLGAVVPSAPPPTNTTQLVAFYKLRVNAAAPNDSYTIETSDSLWSNGIDDAPFNFQGSYNVIVIPEPATAAMIALPLMAWTIRARRRAA